MDTGLLLTLSAHAWHPTVSVSLYGSKNPPDTHIERERQDTVNTGCHQTIVLVKMGCHGYLSIFSL